MKKKPTDTKPFSLEGIVLTTDSQSRIFGSAVNPIVTLKLGFSQAPNHAIATKFGESFGKYLKENMPLILDDFFKLNDRKSEDKKN